MCKGGQKFPSTHWSLILDNERRQECLEELAGKYWTAIYLYARKFGHDRESAQDLTQELFIQLQNGNILEKADPNKGRFRAYLIGILRNMCRRDFRNRKPGKKKILSFAHPFEVSQEKTLITEDVSPEEVFNKEWARLIVNQALAQLREHCRKGEKSDKIKALETFELHFFADKKPAEIAQDLSEDVKWVSEKIYRLKNKYREFLRKIVQETLEENENLDEEIQQIMEHL